MHGNGMQRIKRRNATATGIVFGHTTFVSNNDYNTTYVYYGIILYQMWYRHITYVHSVELTESCPLMYHTKNRYFVDI